MELSFPYGSEVRVISLPAGVTCDTLRPRSLSPLKDPSAAVRAALANPIGAPPLSTILHRGSPRLELVRRVSRLHEGDSVA